MSLRAKINLIVGMLTLLFVAGLTAVQLGAMRDSVKEEVVAANRVATQLLKRNAWLYAAQGVPAMRAFLEGLGRVRSNDLVLTDTDGTVIYRSPESPYKAGRNAPAWFERLISPEPSTQSFAFPDGRLEVRADASRAAVDAWDAFVWFAGIAAVLLVLVNGLVFWLVGRTVRPFGRIVDALGQLQAGRFDVTLPPLPGREAGAIGAAFNRMVAVLAEHIETEKRAVRAEGQLTDQRELAHWVGQRIEQERRTIARELHDELGQSVTAMRSMALSVAQRVQAVDAESADAARLIAQESSRLYDAMHGLIPRLAPLVLDQFGLPDALADLAERTRRAHPGVAVDMQVALDDAALEPDAALALYRAAQEGITNALRHGQARLLRLRVAAEPAAVRLELLDDGQGLPPGGLPAHGHHGLRWLAERVASQHGTLDIGPGDQGRGVRLAVTLPRMAAPALETAP
ncbi:HAMP domain-containing protein [Ideonella sp. A 288]|uniref:HAMP domain-containing protein n=1 Tax=Ideonella sp. A 288 TaxID=1962181 RepID=UPI000B4B4D05|nr:HAMP domain-containing protein [Ideonella sp. A 288]